MIINQRMIGPIKNQGPESSFFVFSFLGFKSIAIQKGPTHRVEIINETS
jgi:hypothetical protein